MSRKTKLWLLAAGALVLAGCILFAGTMAALKWDFSKLSVVRLETNTYPIGESFRDIAVTTDTADIAFAASADGTCSVVVCEDTEHAKHTVTVEEQTLVIRPEQKSAWYDRIGLFLGTPKITVYLPDAQYRALTVTGSTGNVELPQPLAFEHAEISLTTGNADLSASVSGTASIRISTGNIRAADTAVGALDLSATTGAVRVTDVTCRDDLTVQVTTGDAELCGVSCRNLVSGGSVGNLRLERVIAAEQLSIERSTGHVAFTGCDAGEIHVKTDTGNVAGSLLSEKVFLTDSGVGRVDVPKTTSGGVCEIRTDTGNIQITLE